MKRNTRTISALISAFVVVGGLYGTAAGSVVIDRVVAVVNNDIITLSDLQREESLLKKGDAKPDDRAVLEDMIDRKLQLAAAKRAGMDVTDKELADAVADIMKRNHFDTKQFEEALGKEGITLEQYKAELREQMTLSRVFNKNVRSGIAVDEAEVRAYYERNKNQYALPEEVRLRQIEFALPEHATASQVAEVKARAAAVYEKAKKGEDFTKLLRDQTGGGSAAGDGDLGFMQWSEMQPEMEHAARPLKPGGIAEPFQCADSLRIIRLEELRTPVRPYEKVKDEISNMLYQRKVENTYRSWLQTLRTDAQIENKL